MNSRSPQNTHRSDRGDLYKPRFPAGEAIEPPVEVGEKPPFRPEVEKGVEAEPKPPVLEQPPIEPEVPTPEVQPEEAVEEEKPALTIEEARKTGDPDKMLRALETAQGRRGDEEKQ